MKSLNISQLNKIQAFVVRSLIRKFIATAKYADDKNYRRFKGCKLKISNIKAVIGNYDKHYIKELTFICNGKKVILTPTHIYHIAENVRAITLYIEQSYFNVTFNNMFNPHLIIRYSLHSKCY